MTTKGHVAPSTSQRFPVVVEVGGVVLRLRTVWATPIGGEARIEREHGDIDELNCLKNLFGIVGQSEAESFEVVTVPSAFISESSFSD